MTIMAGILSVLKRGPALKTNLAHKVQIDSRTIEKYVPHLITLGFVIRTSAGEYQITHQGLGFLTEYAKIKKYDDI